MSGLLLALPGAMLLAWDYHLRSNYTAIANYFIALNTGLLLAAPCADWIINRRGIGTAARGGCLVGILALVELAFTAPPVAEWWRLPGLLGIGFAASL
ncbi:MAG TPA: hypothetical protein VEQ63_01750, partial [Bryobacteraceae bacterium]|nr:hypothetical protein [Bryobacteraceae bacterium]